MARRYPWSVLDIDPMEDEGAIRKAYAAKLKVTRPDEDPEGFQHLREARDAAIAESRFLRERQAEPEDAPEPIAVIGETSVQMATAHAEPPQSTQPGSPSSADVGTVILVDPHDITVVADEDEGSNPVVDLLEKVGTPHPWRDLKAQWADVFDAMEADTLANHAYNMWMVLPRLLEHMRRDRGQLPDVSEWGFDPRNQAGQLLGPYAAILGDFENRFGILHQDTVLLEYMGDEDARDFINALTIAVGREASLQPGVRQVINVEVIEPRYVEAAWGDDPKMLDYYRKARERDEFPWTFNILALLFPLPVALYYRLRGVAMFTATLVAANAAFAVMAQRGMEVPFAPLASTVYMILIFALAFNWRRIRLQGLASRIRKLEEARLDTLDIVERIRIGTAPSLTEMLLGVAALFMAVGVGIWTR